MTLAYLGLGANLGDARQAIKDAVVCLAQHHSAVTILAKSSLYCSAPIDSDGDDYYNCVAKIETSLSAHDLLALCLKIEHHFGRERPYRNAPRTLDLDVLLYGSDIISTPDLHVPHPRMAERAFVLVPLLELDADLEIPGLGRAARFLPGVADQRLEKVQTCQCPLAAKQAADAARETPSCS